MKSLYIKPETEIVNIFTDCDVMQLIEASYNNLPGEQTQNGIDDEEGDLDLCSKGSSSLWDFDIDD